MPSKCERRPPTESLRSDLPCLIKAETKKRNGDPQWWCFEHGEDASGAGGLPLEECPSAALGPVDVEDILTLIVDDYPGGIGVWAALPAPLRFGAPPGRRGVHVHARRVADGPKVLDDTFQIVRLVQDDVVFEVDTEAAIAHMATTIAGHRVKLLVCPRCSYVHTDRDRFAVTPHRRHQCQRCGRYFWDRERSISNTTASWAGLFDADRTLVPAQEHLDLSLDAFSTVVIWASSSAIVWTSPADEMEGLHVHARDHDGRLVVDETYGSVTVDGELVEPEQVRLLMVQLALPLTRSRVADLVCPSCGAPHFDSGTAAFEPSNRKRCDLCDTEFITPRRRKVVCNPSLQFAEGLKQRS